MTPSRLATADAVQGLLFAACIVLFGYQAFSIWYPTQGALGFYYSHLGAILVITSLSLAADRLKTSPAPARADLLRATGYLVPLASAVASTAYLTLSVSAIELRQPFITSTDLFFGIALIGSVLWLSWSVWGKVLTALMGLAILYLTFGHWIPGQFGHREYESGMVVSYLAGMGGARGVLWGIPLSADTLFLILVFGGLLAGTRVLELFDEIGKLLLNVTRAGVCYSAVIASSLIGMVTGQAVANIALSGSMTIPSMKQRGTSADTAGAIEILASLGSQLLPPIMGLAAFLMAVTLGVPYIDIVSAAVVPAILYVATIVIALYFLVQASPQISATKADPDRRLIAWMLPSFLSAFGTLIVLLYWRYSPGYAALWGIAVLVGTSMLRPPKYRPTWRTLMDGVSRGVIGASKMALVLAGIGLIVQVLITTGAGFDLGRVAMGWADGNVLAALILGMLIALFVGLGLPTPAAYALIAIIMIPALIDVGIEPIVAHFFGFYFVIFSAITPPVGVGIMTATRISEGTFYGTFRECMKIAVVSILIPFTFVAFPSVLNFPDIGWDALLACAALIVATGGWASSVYGVMTVRLTTLERMALLVAPCSYIAILLTKNIWFVLPLLGAVAFVRGRTSRRARLNGDLADEHGTARNAALSNSRSVKA